MKRLPLAVLAIVALLAFAAAGAVWRFGDPNSPSSQRSQPETRASSGDELGGSFALTDQDGMRRTDTDFRGKFMLVFFGYTYCPDVCPTTLAVEAEALDKLGSRANAIAPIFITVDPKRDTSQKLKAYLSAFDAKPLGSRPNFIGLTGSDEEIAEAAKAYRVYYQAHLDGQTRDGADYSIDHSGDVYLMSPEGKFLAYYSQGIMADELANDLAKRTRR
jgi:cytochrome oxidase Cu insertion factor (SCO1/SenC/PrrC family)